MTKKPKSLARTSKSDIGKLKRRLDIAFAKMIRERDKYKSCIDLCGRIGLKYQAGHFRRRELMSTRWNYKNVNGQNAQCNCFDNDGYRHAKGIDARWGKGTAEKLYRLSQKVKQWEVQELLLLLGATQNYEDYVRVYDSITI